MSILIKKTTFLLVLFSLPVIINAQIEKRTATKPNILIILADDLGYSDIGCYGGEIKTPNIDRLAAGGVKFAQMYNTAKCSPSRASMLTGLYYHRTNADYGNAATMGEVLRPAGYTTFWSGKQHAPMLIMVMLLLWARY